MRAARPNLYLVATWHSLRIHRSAVTHPSSEMMMMMMMTRERQCLLRRGLCYCHCPTCWQTCCCWWQRRNPNVACQSLPLLAAFFFRTLRVKANSTADIAGWCPEVWLHGRRMKTSGREKHLPCDLWAWTAFLTCPWISGAPEP